MPYCLSCFWVVVEARASVKASWPPLLRLPPRRTHITRKTQNTKRNDTHKVQQASVEAALASGGFTVRKQKCKRARTTDSIDRVLTWLQRGGSDGGGGEAEAGGDGVPEPERPMPHAETLEAKQA